MACIKGKRSHKHLFWFHLKLHYLATVNKLVAEERVTWCISSWALSMNKLHHNQEILQLDWTAVCLFYKGKTQTKSSSWFSFVVTLIIHYRWPELKLRHWSTINHLWEIVVGTPSTLCLLALLGMEMSWNGNLLGVVIDQPLWLRGHGQDTFMMNTYDVSYGMIWGMRTLLLMNMYRTFWHNKAWHEQPQGLNYQYLDV